MSYQDHLKTCSYCNKDPQKVTVPVKSASSYYKEKKLSELAAIIKGTKAASSVTITKSYPSDRTNKLRELGKMIKGL